MKNVRLVAGLLGFLSFVSCWAQTYPGQYVWEEFDKRIKASEKVRPLGPNSAGDQASLSNGALSFSATDISLPGSNSLKVEFSRAYSAFSRKGYGDLGMLADWIVDLPSINGVFAPNWVVGPGDSSNRCTDSSVPRVDEPFRTNDFWQGLEINIPGVTRSELLRTLPGVATPSDGKSYYWLTNDRVHVACLNSIQNGTGQGFLAITPDGTRYTFDWMGQTPETVSYTNTYDTAGVRYGHSLARKKNYIYATRVEDRFGNYVTYTYSNAWNSPGKLKSIAASDGRTISITYDGDTLSKVSDGTHTWSYSYVSMPSGRKTLRSVVLPDSSAWVIDLGTFTEAEIKYYDAPPAGETLRTCMVNAIPINIGANFVGSITHPAGAKSEFTLGIFEHGRSFVPISCRNVVTKIVSGPNKGADNKTDDDVNNWATSSYSLTLTRKSVSGPGQAAVAWDYGYQPNFSFYMYPGTTMIWPVCDTASYDCAQPPCANDSCAKYSVTTVSGPNNEWKRYVYGNTYRYNEGKLVRTEAGAGAESLLRTETHSYDLSRVDQVYPAQFGTSGRLNGEGFQSEFHRPETGIETVQQGVQFVRRVDLFDSVARPAIVTLSSGAASDPAAPYIAVPILTAPATATAGAAHTLSWAAVSGAATYELERQVDGGSFSASYQGSASSAALIYPSPATLKYRVRACNAFGTCGAFSAEKTVVVVAAVSIGTPVLTVPAQVGAGVGFVVQWTAVAGATQYVLERRTGTGAYSIAYSGAALSVIQKIKVATTVRYRVKACDSASNCGAFSAVGMVVIKSTGDPGEP